MKLRLNLATAPQENKRPFLTGSIFVGIVALAALFFLSHEAYSSWRASRTLRNDVSRWQREIRTTRQEQAELAVYFSTPEALQMMDRSKFLNSLIAERSFPWTKIFMDLEETLPPGVRVVSISPRLIDGRAEVGLEISAANEDGVVRFLEAMENSKAFSGMVVKSNRLVPGEAASSLDRIVVDLSVWYATT
jgi:Tfp pilus assembly protein PilN